MMRPMKPACAFFLTLPLLGCATTARDFRTSVPGAEGYVYTKIDDGNRIRESLTNPAVRDQIPFEKATANIVVGYTRIFDKKSNRTTTYRSEIARSGQEVVFVITDMATNEVVTRKVFPPAEPHAVPRDCTPGPYATLPECYADYHCLCGLALQCIADRTCETQYDSYICCANRGTPNETCVSAHLYFAPSSLRCQVLNPDILGGGIAIRQ